eukprot:2011631-Ditylum_brightwellii.AAC.1
MPNLVLEYYLRKFCWFCNLVCNANTGHPNGRLSFNLACTGELENLGKGHDASSSSGKVLPLSTAVLSGYGQRL